MFFNGKAQSKCVGEFEYCLFSDLPILTSMAKFVSAMGNTKKLISRKTSNPSRTSPPSARAAAMRSMQNNISKQNYINHLETPLKFSLKFS